MSTLVSVLTDLNSKLATLATLNDQMLDSIREILNKLDIDQCSTPHEQDIITAFVSLSVIASNSNDIPAYKKLFNIIFTVPVIANWLKTAAFIDTENRYLSLPAKIAEQTIKKAGYPFVLECFWHPLCKNLPANTEQHKQNYTSIAYQTATISTNINLINTNFFEKTIGEQDINLNIDYHPKTLALIINIEASLQKLEPQIYKLRKASSSMLSWMQKTPQSLKNTKSKATSLSADSYFQPQNIQPDYVEYNSIKIESYLLYLVLKIDALAHDSYDTQQQLEHEQAFKEIIDTIGSKFSDTSKNKIIQTITAKISETEHSFNGDGNLIADPMKNLLNILEPIQRSSMTTKKNFK